MKIEVSLGDDIRKLMKEVETDVGKAAMAAMRDTAPVAAQELREQVTAAGLGQRLANTWRWRTYPDQGARRAALNPAGYIWSRAPDIIDSFERGAQVYPIAGRRFLAIPTDAVPRARGRRGSTRRMTPAQVEHAFNSDLFFKRGRAGRVLAFLNVVQSRNGQTFRPGTKRRLAQGRALKPVLMFVLVPSVRMPKLLDLNGPAERWASAFEAEFTRRLEAS